MESESTLKIHILENPIINLKLVIKVGVCTYESFFEEFPSQEQILARYIFILHGIENIKTLSIGCLEKICEEIYNSDNVIRKFDKLKFNKNILQSIFNNEHSIVIDDVQCHKIIKSHISRIESGEQDKNSKISKIIFKLIDALDIKLDNI